MPVLQPLHKPDIVLCNNNHHHNGGGSHSPEELSPSPPHLGINMNMNNGFHKLTKKHSGCSLDTADNGIPMHHHHTDPSPPRYGQWEEVLLSTSPFVTGFLQHMSPSPSFKSDLERTGPWKSLKASEYAKNTVNPIRRIVDVMSVQPNPDKALIKLHLGDPTLTGSLKTDPAVVQAVQDALLSGKYNGYGPAVGIQEVREALAQFVSTAETPVVADDIILTSGCSHALELAIEVMANPGDNILVPSPGFPLYATLMRPHGVEERHYNLLVEHNWEVDLVHLESLIDQKTRAIVLNNPSNPCGAVYSAEHLQSVLRIADKYGLPIIADEIYGDMVYDGAVFHPLATLEPKVPIITCDGIGKRYLVPGWRLGWLIINDPTNSLKHIRDGLRNLAQKIVGPSALMQGALPAILRNSPASFFEKTRNVISKNAQVAMEVLCEAPGLRPVCPKGAMYMMVGLSVVDFPKFQGNEMEFIKALIAEESVYCLPGSVFHHPNSFRLVLTYAEDVTRDACERIKNFCTRYFVKQNHHTSLITAGPNRIVIPKKIGPSPLVNNNDRLIVPRS